MDNRFKIHQRSVSSLSAVPAAHVAAALETGSKCSFITYKLRFFTCFYLAPAASITFFNSLANLGPDNTKLKLNFLKSHPITATTMVTNPLKLQS